MLTNYPPLPPADVARAGETWVACDVDSCTNEAAVTDGMPAGWITTDPDGDPLQGASQYCPTHAARAVDIAPTPEPFLERDVTPDETPPPAP